MFRFAVVAAVGALSAAGAARALSTIERPAAAEPEAQLRRTPSAAVYDVAGAAPAVGAASVAKSADGHFWAQGVVNGKQVRFLVDTGASAVALTQADALRLGFQKADLKSSATVNTANGVARVAPVDLDSVTIAGARVTGVKAFVVENGLETSLLGMTYLGRLSRFEATQHALILRP